MMLRHAGADRDRLRAAERRVGEIARFERDAGQQLRQCLAVRRIEARIGDSHVRAVPGEVTREREPGHAETEHDRATAVVTRLH